MIRHMQFTAVVVMTLLTTVMAVLPQRVARNRVTDRSRWLMAVATLLLAVQFALQYKLRLRDMGVTQAVVLNLPFFILASILLSMAILCLQRRGTIHRHEWMVGIATWGTTVAMLAVAAATDGMPLLNDTPQLRWAEAAGSVLYALMQGYYAWLTTGELRRMRKAVAAYYDRSMDGILNWMERSVWLLTAIAILVPLMIFTNGSLLGLFALMIFTATFYLVICFLCYMVSSDQQLVEVAEAVDVPAPSQPASGGRGDTSEAFAHIVEAVEQWTAHGGHLRQELNIQAVADEMHVQRSMLTAWLKTTEWEVFATWLTHLRIEEAKRVLKEHPDWSNDYVAQHCGFGSRTYFQKKFKETLGVSPGEYVRGVHLFSCSLVL